MTKTSKKPTTSPKPGKAIAGSARRPDAPVAVADRGDEIDRLDTMTLGELQKVFAEVTGKSTRCPNKAWLQRRIREATAASLTEASSGAEDEDDINDTGSGTGSGEASPEVADDNAPNLEVLAASSAPGTAVDEPEALNQPAEGEEAAGLNAERVEPAATATAATPGDGATGASASRRPRHQKSGSELMVLPLRMEADVVDQLDAAYRRHGLRSRMHLFRHALRAYLASVGEDDVASLLADKA